MMNNSNITDCIDISIQMSDTQYKYWIVWDEV